MVALAILSIAVLGLVSTHIYSMKASSGDRMRHTASVIAYQIMNENEDNLRKNFAASVATTQKIDVPGKEDYDYSIQDTYEGSNDLKKIAVTLYWMEEGAERDYTVTTYVYKYQ